jgi:Putative beta-barrel porin-2, OmpL-like. bbp2
MKIVRSRSARQAPWLIVLVAVIVLMVLLISRSVHADNLPLPVGQPVNGGPLSPLTVQGMLSGLAMSQSNATASEQSHDFEIDNAQLIVHKTSGPLQFLIQGGAYTFPVIGTPLPNTADTSNNLFGPVPVAYLQWNPAPSVSIQAGKLPTLVGAEGAWPWGNIDIQRGLLWNLENTITRGVQMNYAGEKLSASLAWNDGFYSNRYDNLTASLSYAITTSDTLNAIVFDPFRTTTAQSSATSPVFNNARTYDLIYTHTQGPWMIQPYLQYTMSPASDTLGFTDGNHVWGAALLAAYQFTPAWTLGGRIEYVSSSGASNTSANNDLLGYGPGSRARTLTVTPVWQDGGLFVRAEWSYIKVINGSPGTQFGTQRNDSTQMRVLLESGVMF